MKTTIKELMKENPMLEFIVTQGLTETLRGDKKFDAFIKKCKKDKDGKNVLDIRLTVNGVEVDVNSFVRRWEKHVEVECEKEINKKALDLFREKSQDAIEKIQNVVRVAERRLKKELNVVEDQDDC